MAGSKWNIASVNVQGQAMFGDNNRMAVELAGLNVPDKSAVSTALSKLNERIQATVAGSQESLSLTDKAELQRILSHIIEELKKPPESQRPGFLRQCLDKVMEVASAVPPLIKTALELKNLLGF